VHIRYQIRIPIYISIFHSNHQMGDIEKGAVPRSPCQTCHEFHPVTISRKSRADGVKRVSDGVFLFSPFVSSSRLLFPRSPERSIHLLPHNWTWMDESYHDYPIKTTVTSFIHGVSANNALHSVGVSASARVSYPCLFLPLQLQHHHQQLSIRRAGTHVSCSTTHRHLVIFATHIPNSLP